MKIIEEMADAYCRENAQQEGYDIVDVRNAYLSGAEHVHEELTCWNDPKESVPEHEWAVLVKITTRIYDVASYSSKIGRWVIENYSLGRDEIIGWREIH